MTWSKQDDRESGCVRGGWEEREEGLGMEEPTRDDAAGSWGGVGACGWAGTLKCANGDVYEGELKDDKANGRGGSEGGGVGMGTSGAETGRMRA